MALETQQDASFILNEIVNRLRSLESKHSSLAEKTLLINKNMIDEYKSLAHHTKSMEMQLKEIAFDISKLKEIIKDFAKESENYARKDNIKVLEKYINLIDPIKSVTSDDVRKIVKEVIKSEQR